MWPTAILQTDVRVTMPDIEVKADQRDTELKSLLPLPEFGHTSSLDMLKCYKSIYIQQRPL